MASESVVKHALARIGAYLALAVAAAALGCRAPSPKPRALSDAGDLKSRPLYTFSEAELDRYLRRLHQEKPDLARRVVHLGRKNIGQPYEIFLLGEFPYELYDPDPIYCLARSDCLTFCEHTFAMALSDDWWSFLRTLQRIRYRDGVIGMLTRNHFTIADWNRNNAFIFADLTTSLGQGRACVPLRQTCRRAAFFARFGIGQEIPDEPIADHYIPKANVPAVLDELRNGDFVNIIRGDDDSQWASHTGMIAIADDGTVDFLHSGVPVVQEEPLLTVLEADRRCVGIKILRLHPDAEQIMRSLLASASEATELSEATLTSALAASLLMSTGAPPSYASDWSGAMRLQSYRLPHDAPRDPALQHALEEIDQRFGDELGIPPNDRAFGVLDLTDLGLATIQPDVMFYGAGVPRICIVMAYFATHPQAAEDLDPALERELQLVIKRSSNELADKYSQIAGLENIRDLLQSSRYQLYDEKHGGGFWCGKHYGIDQPRIGDPLSDLPYAVTVRQCLRYYLMLEQGRLVSAPVCAMLKQIFAAPQLEFRNDGFVRGLNGRQATIIRKNGLWENWHLDTARIQHGDRLYLLAGMARHPHGEAYLVRMTAAIDAHLCGPRPSAPFSHQTILHDVRSAFRPGTFQNARPDESGDGAILTPTAGGNEAIYESPVIETDIKFNEAVVSWNVGTPAGAGFCVEIRVGRRFDDSWTPYLHIGNWGDPLPGGEPVVTCEEGRIDVDCLRSEQRFDCIQYRIRAACVPGCEAELRIERVAVCVSDLTGIPAAILRDESTAPPPPPEEWQRRLPVPFRSQRTEDPELAGRICSPTSLAMVMEYRGVARSTDEAAHACYDPRHDIYGNWPRNIQAAYTFGIPGYLTRFADWTDVKRMIAAGQPLVISIRVRGGAKLTGAPYESTEGHLLVLTGFDEDGNVYVNEPAVSTAEASQLTYARGELEEVWMRGSGGLAYVLLPVQPDHE